MHKISANIKSLRFLRVIDLSADFYRKRFLHILRSYFSQGIAVDNSSTRMFGLGPFHNNDCLLKKLIAAILTL